ncbi:hypothetical protein KZ292_28045, partial [Escherichia coli]|nr:hypothetical protein [Escherichia coli]
MWYVAKFLRTSPRRGFVVSESGKIMSEPLTAGVAAGSAGVTFAALFPEATPAVMICALAGAALY